jgi:glyoxylase-like metal-dependent hydrolase (beta-lactamase superfamily II)
MRIHAIQTGVVSVKHTFRTLAGPAWARQLTMLLDRSWTEWLPIYVWVIEHPEGIILVDCGETSHITDSDYANCDRLTHFTYRRLLKFRVEEHEEIGPQLTQLGINPNDVRWLILTHLHSDQVGGLPYFPRARIMVSRQDFTEPHQGSLPCRWPDWFRPYLVEYLPQSLGAFTLGHQVTRAGDLFIVPTPGHSPGHQSVMLWENGLCYLFAGDATFNQSQLLKGQVAGICQNVAAAQHTIQRLRSHVAQVGTVYLPTHDPDAPRRLAAQSTAPRL